LVKILITGGAGFIGSHLTRACLDAGHAVIVIDTLVNSAAGQPDPRARFYQIDIRDQRLHKILAMERPDIVSHHAASRPSPLSDPLADPPLSDADINLRGLLNLLDGCVAAAIPRFIFASGGNDLYGGDGSQPLPLAEESALAPRRASDIAKLAGEWYVRYYTRRYGIEHLILRYADVYGETDRQRAQHPLTGLIYALLEQRRVVICTPAGEQRDHIFIDDVVRAHLLALERRGNWTINISSGRARSLEELYWQAAALLGVSGQPLYLGERDGQTRAIALDNSRAQRLLHWHPEVEPAEGIRRTLLAIAALLGQTLAAAAAASAAPPTRAAAQVARLPGNGSSAALVAAPASA
jgi:UDP-glucose 4-epimerase